MPPTRRRCQADFMGVPRATARVAVAAAVEYARAHPFLRAARRATPVASLIDTCAAAQFNPERCAVPLGIPFRRTVPAHQPQYALGRVETLLRAGYYNAGGCIRALNLEYSGRGLTWDIALNDFFVACAAARKHPFGVFPARLVLDVVAVRPPPPARGRGRGRGGRGGRLENAPYGNVGRDNVVQRARVRVPVALARVGPDSVTARELCQLAEVFGMRLYEPRDQTGPTRVAFFSHHRAVPRAFQAGWKPFDAEFW